GPRAAAPGGPAPVQAAPPGRRGDHDRGAAGGAARPGPPRARQALHRRCLVKAVCWYGPHDVRVEQVDDPRILNARDAIVKVSSTAICGSDLHLYNGFVPTMAAGDILGHEFMGEVVEVGPEVKELAVGDRVVVPFPIACGSCFASQDGLFAVCEN